MNACLKILPKGYKVTMGIDLQLDGLTAGQKYPLSQKEKGMIFVSASRETILHLQLRCR